MGKWFTKLIFILLLFLAPAAFAADYYAVHTGGATSGECPTGTPCTLPYALSLANSNCSAGSPCSVKLKGSSVTFESAQISLNPGVSLTADTQTTPTPSVTVKPSASMGYTNPLILIASGEGAENTTGNQTVSYLTLDGTNGGYQAQTGIRVVNRDEVTIDHCIITNFKGHYESKGLIVESTGLDANNNAQSADYWPTYIDPMMMQYESKWTDDGVDNFTFTNNVMTYCGESQATDVTNCTARTGKSIETFHLKNLIFENNVIDGSHSRIKTWQSSPAFIKTASVKNNVFKNHESGLHPCMDYGKTSAFWAVEIWCLEDVLFSNNKLWNGTYSTTVGWDNEWVDNFVDTSTATSNNARFYTYIEATFMNNANIHRNYFKQKATNSHNNHGVVIGSEDGHSRWNESGSNPVINYVYNNIFEKMPNAAVWIKMFHPGYAFTFHIYNNVFKLRSEDGDQKAHCIWADQNFSGNTATINAKNNIFSYGDYAIKLTNPASITVNASNNIYSNLDTAYPYTSPTSIGDADLQEDWQEITPTYDEGYEPALTGSQVNNGVTITGLAFDISTAMGTTTDWGSEYNTPYVAIVDQDANGDWEVGPYVLGDEQGGGGEPPSTPVTVDNTDAGFATPVGSWGTSVTIPGFYGSNYRYIASGSGTNYATWTFTGLAGGQYSVYAQWAAYSNRASDAPYTITDGTGDLATVDKDQRINGGQMNLLWSGTVQAGTLTIKLTDNADGYVIADAVQIVGAVGPEIVSATIPSSGESVSLVFSEAMPRGGSFAYSDFALSGTDLAQDMTGYSSGDGTITIVLTCSKIYSGDSGITVAHTQPGDGLEADDDGADLGSFSLFPVFNNSTQTSPSSPLAPRTVIFGTGTSEVTTGAGSKTITFQ